MYGRLPAPPKRALLLVDPGKLLGLRYSATPMGPQYGTKLKLNSPLETKLTILQIIIIVENCFDDFFEIWKIKATSRIWNL